MKRVVDISPCAFGQIICTKCKISSDIGWYKTDGIDIFCPICDFKMGYFKQKRNNEDKTHILNQSESE